jgi:osmotically-inducible protein OsmY
MTRRGRGRAAGLVAPLLACAAAGAAGPPARADEPPARVTPRQAVEIEERLARDRELADNDVDVYARRGVLVLSGWVDSPAEQVRAEDVARAIVGVHARIRNSLVLEGSPFPPGTYQPDGVAGRGGRFAAGGATSDAAIAGAVRGALLLDERVDAERVQVTAEEGVVTLSGFVWYDDERQRAIAIARSVEGVVRVIDRLEGGTTSPPGAAPR